MTRPAGRKNRLPDLGPRGEGWVVGQLLLLGLLLVVSLPRLVDLSPRSTLDGGWLVAGAGALISAGFVLLTAFRGLGRSLTPMPRPRDDATLVVSGIFATIRHPIYASLILGGLGWSALTRSLPAAGVSLLLAAFLDVKARREEAWLADRYPGYRAYASRTRRFLPRVY